MSTTNRSALCLEAEESISQLLDGTAQARLYDHVAECDGCRDLRHDAGRAVELTAASGGDFQPRADFVEKLIERLEASRPETAPAMSRAESPGTKAACATLVMGDARVDSVLASAPTTFNPIPHEHDTEILAARPVPATHDGDASDVQSENFRTVLDVRGATMLSAESDRPAMGSPPVVGPTLEERDRDDARGTDARSSTDARSAEARSSTDALRSHETGAPHDARSAAPVEHRSGAVPATVLAAGSSSTGSAAPRQVVALHPAAKRSTVSRLRRPALIAGVVGTLAAAAAVGMYVKGKVGGPAPADPQAGWTGSVASVSRAAADKTGGLEACDAAGACATVTSGAAIAQAAVLRTDARTRAYLTLSDGTALALDRGSQLELIAGRGRSARLVQGAAVLDVATVAGAPAARVAFAHGDVEVLGTKLALTATGDRATVEVARGIVRMHSENGKTVDVRAGEEATLLGGSDPVVASSSSIADTMEWSDRTPEETDAPVLRGLGELRARKPGQTKERDHAVHLAKHAVKVRVVDIVARTEVDETFANDTDEELEGIFRFPLPPGAQIERLALEVDGKLLDGAFVDRDRGAAIWRGAIQRAAPTAPRPREEIVWVPGPWRDPALLEWQRGGRFELRIFPIPKRGSRRVVLTYTQVLDQAAGIRRYTYPLAHDSSGTTKIDAFDLDLQVLGHDKALGLQTRGYELTSGSSDGSAERKVMHADAFVPAGDLTVEYALPDRDREVTAWAYRMDSVPVPASTGSAGKATPAVQRTAKGTAEEKAAAEAAAAIVNDTSPYVAIAVRPKLPRWQEAKERLHVVVVDSSRSMVGERFARATRLASSLVREMDRRDSFLLLACDTTCRSMSAETTSASSGSGATASRGPLAPGASAAGDVERFLGAIEPEGGSDLAAAMSAARAAAGGLGGKELRVIYLGDGTPSVGPTRPAHLEAAVRNTLSSGEAAVVAVALGSDADMTSLGALARGGGGVVVPYVPGQKVSTAALEVLGAAYGVVLRDPEVELPAGLTQVTPGRLDPIRAGGETILVARMNGSEIAGTIKLKGRVAGERFEQTYPTKIVATSNAGNAFVPRLYAAAKIAELEQAGGETQKATMIELSRRFAVASRHTSLLVLESEAMFNAFGLVRDGIAPTFTGEERAESSSANAEGAPPEEDAPVAASGDGADSPGFLGRSAGGATKSPPAPRRADPSDPLSNPFGEAAPTTPPAASMGPVAKPAEPKAAAREGASSTRRPAPDDDFLSRDRRRQNLVPMRKVFDRKASFEATNSLAQQNLAKLAVAESALQAQPDSRDKTVELFALYATSGRIGEAQELTAKWSGRDALDPDAITARADLAARQGDRERAVRILGGLADVRPGDKAPQIRLAELQEAAGNQAFACQHRIALADIAPSDAKIVADAVRCARAQGMVDLASLLKSSASDKTRTAVDTILAANPVAKTQDLRGDVRVSADWSGAADLDIALIDAQGKRISWLGSAGKTGITARDVQSARSEALALTSLPAGNYVVEIVRARGDSADPIRGEITLQLVGDTRKVPFTLTGARAEVGTVRVFFTSRLVPIDDPFWGFR